MNHAVLLVSTFLSPGAGGRSVAAELAGQLSGAGWPVVTTSSRASRPLRLIDMLATVWRERTHYELAQVDVFSGPAFAWAEIVCAALRMMRRPYVLTLHGGNLPRFAGRWPRRVRRLLASAAAVTTPSAYLLEGMIPYRADLRLLPNALDLTRYEHRIRRTARPDLMWLRAFHSTYDPSLAVRTLARLSAPHPKARLTMIGPDKGDGSLQASRTLAASLGISTRVTFRGGIAKTAVPPALNESDIFLNTSTIDNTPVSVLEAMACGLCIVSTNVGGLPYLLKDGTDALLVPPGDAEAMAGSVTRILEEPALAEHLSRNARASVQSFDWNSVLPQWLTLLRQVVEGGRS